MQDSVAVREVGRGSGLRVAPMTMAVDMEHYTVLEEQMKLLMDKVRSLKQHNKTLKDGAKVSPSPPLP